MNIYTKHSFAAFLITWTPKPRNKDHLLLTACVSHSHVDGFVQDCSISIANALEILQSCIKPSTSLPHINSPIPILFPSVPRHMPYLFSATRTSAGASTGTSGTARSVPGFSQNLVSQQHPFQFTHVFYILHRPCQYHRCAMLLLQHFKTIEQIWN